MKTTAKKALDLQAEYYLSACENDFRDSQIRLEQAKKILFHVRSGKEMGSCPLPLKNESSDSVKKYAAKLDLLIGLCYTEECGE